MPTTDDYIQAGWHAAPAFGLAARSIDLLSHSENVVLCVVLEGGDQVAMRLHRPGYNTIDELRSEVQWVQSLARAGVPVPAARELDAGGHYTTVKVADEQRHVGVVSWVDGEPIGSWAEAAGADLVDRYHQIGAVAARIRSHNEQWVAPSGFVRRRWDADGLVGLDPHWGRFWEVAQLSSGQRQLFARARERLHAELAALSTEGDRFGLIHADLHLGNLMTNGETLTVIDFDDAGYGWFAHEFAMSLHPILDEPVLPQARAAMIAGYREVANLDKDEERLIDTFLVVRCLMIVGWLAARPELPTYDRIEGVIEATTEVAERYLGG